MDESFWHGIKGILKRELTKDKILDCGISSGPLPPVGADSTGEAIDNYLDRLYENFDFRELADEIKLFLTKGNVALILFAIIAFIGLAIFEHHLYYEEGRWAARDMLTVDYYTWPPELQAERNAIMQKYGFTDDDINPNKVMGLER